MPRPRTIAGHVDLDGIRYSFTYSVDERRIEDICRDDLGEVPDGVYEMCDTLANQTLYAEDHRRAKEWRR